MRQNSLKQHADLLQRWLAAFCWNFAQATSCSLGLHCSWLGLLFVWSQPEKTVRNGCAIWRAAASKFQPSSGQKNKHVVGRAKWQCRPCFSPPEICNPSFAMLSPSRTLFCRPPMIIYFTQKFFCSNVFCILVELLALLGRAHPVRNELGIASCNLCQIFCWPSYDTLIAMPWTGWNLLHHHSRSDLPIGNKRPSQCWTLIGCLLCLDLSASPVTSLKDRFLEERDASKSWIIMSQQWTVV